ncbi:MAG: hypothetical protein SCM11_15695 [Bacillota bacterium]|nr:hypothetical protein [Bacillota bacterium]
MQSRTLLALKAEFEVKAKDDVRSRSLAVYQDKNKSSAAVRLSAKNAGVEPPLYSVPLYLTSRLAGWLTGSETKTHAVCSAATVTDN